MGRTYNKGAKMRKTYCMGCRKMWEEPRDIPIEESFCPNCGKKILRGEQE